MSARRWRFIACAAVVALTMMSATLGCAEGGTSGGDGGTSMTATPPATGSSTTVATSSPTTIPFASTTAPVSTTKPPAKPPPTLAPGAPAPGKEYAKVPGKARVVALTFDAAYDPEPLAAILEALAAAHAPATFFLTGEFVADYPDSVAKIVRAGFPIGNHSYSHPDFTTLSEAEMRSQLERTAALIEDAGASTPGLCSASRTGHVTSAPSPRSATRATRACTGLSTPSTGSRSALRRRSRRPCSIICSREPSS